METEPSSGSGTASGAGTANVSATDSGPMLSGGTVTTTGGGSTTTAGSGSTTGTDSGTATGTSGGMQPDAGTCMPGDPDCKVCESAFSEFLEPSYKCSWNEEFIYSLSLVADLENDGTVEIVTTIGGQSGVYSEDGKLLVIRGSDCTERYRSPMRLFAYGSSLAVADLDGDSDLEVVGLLRDFTNPFGGTTNEVVVTDHMGNVLAISPPASVVEQASHEGGPVIADLDGQAPPEIVYAGMALRFEDGGLTTLWSNDFVEESVFGIYSVVADVDLDGVPEVLTGNRIFDGLTGEEETPDNVLWFDPGYVGVADIDDSTPEPEVVLVSVFSDVPPVLRVYHPVTGDLVIGPLAFGVLHGSPPTMADFDGDGQAEIGVGAAPGYFVFDLECDPNNLPAFCAAPWIRWQLDDSSGTVFLTPAFDFDGDGRAELVYADGYDRFRILDGMTGDVLVERTSFTASGGTVVADVDLDGHAEIVIGSAPLTEWDAPKGVYVFEDPQDRWGAARPIWNQHTYHVTNVNPDGSIPEVETNNWTVWNNYRQQVGPEDKPCIPMP